MAAWTMGRQVGWLGVVCVLVVARSASRSGPKSVSVTVRNLSGREVMVSWLSVGTGERVAQTPKPTKPSASASIDSYEGHSFVVEAVDATRDADPQCAVWASVGECTANPGYMLSACRAACSGAAYFTVGRYEELLTVEANWTVTRTGPGRRAREVLEAAARDCERAAAAGALSECSASDGDASDGDTCGFRPASCWAREMEARLWVRLRQETALERALFESSYAAFPKAPARAEDAAKPERKKADEDVGAIRKLAADGEVALNRGLGGCVDFEACVDVAATAAEAAHAGIAALRQATRRRNEAVRNATCADEALGTGALVEGTTLEGEAATFVFEGHPGRDLFYRPDAIPEARVSLIDGFASADECDALIQDARPRLRTATHAKDGELTVVSKSRDAQQATVSDARNPAAKAVRARAVRLANALSNYSLQIEGQEHLMAIQYNPGQQYMLHCDGDCSGQPYTPRGRLATVLVYCRVAAKGGATAFPNAAARVQPSQGAAVYFHFRGSEPNSLTENWHTEHSGCPVLDGEKWVITSWLRDAVDTSHPASGFTPFGEPI